MLRNLTLVYQVRRDVLEDVFRSDSPEYREFLGAYKEDPKSPRTKVLAERVINAFSFYIAIGQYTALSEQERQQAILAAEQLRSFARPDAIFLSRQSVVGYPTYHGFAEGWPEISRYRLIEDERLRDRDLAFYRLPEVYDCLNPGQRLLREGLGGDYYYRPIQGENMSDVQERMRSFLRTFSGSDYFSSLNGVSDVLAFVHESLIVAMVEVTGGNQLEARELQQRLDVVEDGSCGIAFCRFGRRT